jgi:ABC-type multidrug transport system fused ATPase/permease subunit
MATPLLVLLVGVFLADSYFIHDRLHRIENNQKSMRSLINKELQEYADSVREVREILESNNSHRQ